MSWASAIDLMLFTITALTLYAALRALMLGGRGPRRSCRRWRRVAAVTVVLVSCLQVAMPIDPVMLAMIAIAALDCWLVTLTAPPETEPRAIVHRRPPACLRGSR